MQGSLIIEIAKEIQKLYEQKIKTILDENALAILDSLKKAFNMHDSQFNLVFTNSVYKNKKSYTFTHRIKDSNSLFEKLQRKNQIFEIIQKLEINSTGDLKAKEDGLQEILFDLKDNIGFRVLCDLGKDTENAFSLIKNHENNFENIKFTNIATQPDTKKNGLKIYRLDCIWADKIKFELQIKSKLESAWDDLEHDMYYKDHRISTIKKINKKSLMHIGQLLKQIDSFMLDLREMNSPNPDQEFSDVKKLERIENIYASKIKEAISEDFIFDFSSITEQILFIEQRHAFTEDIGKHFKTYFDAILSNAVKRHDTWEIIILESIFRELIAANDEDKFKDIYFEFIVSKAGNPIEERVRILRKLYDNAFMNLSGEKHLVQYSTYIDMLGLYNTLLDNLDSEELDEEAQLEIGLIFFGLKDDIENCKLIDNANGILEILTKHKEAKQNTQNIIKALERLDK